MNAKLWKIASPIECHNSLTQVFYNKQIPAIGLGESMEAYLNKSGNSGVIAYEIGSDFIRVKFKNSDYVYLYNHQKPGSQHIEKMKTKAIEGLGLATYISQYVDGNYFKKERIDHQI